MQYHMTGEKHVFFYISNGNIILYLIKNNFPLKDPQGCGPFSKLFWGDQKLPKEFYQYVFIL